MTSQRSRQRHRHTRWRNGTVFWGLQHRWICESKRYSFERSLLSLLPLCRHLIELWFWGCWKQRLRLWLVAVDVAAACVVRSLFRFQNRCFLLRFLVLLVLHLHFHTVPHSRHLNLRFPPLHQWMRRKDDHLGGLSVLAVFSCNNTFTWKRTSKIYRW